MLFPDKKVIFKFSLLLIALFLAFRVLAFLTKKDPVLDFQASLKMVKISDNGLFFQTKTSSDSVASLLEERNIDIGSHDEIIPEIGRKLYPGAVIEIRRAVKVQIEADGEKINGYALGRTVRDALEENGVELGRLDKTLPDPNSPLQNDTTIVVTRINVEEVTKEESIDFKVTAKNDSKLGWREKKIETPGEKGIKEVKYKITYHNGKEISRVILEKTVTKEPINQIEVQGTYVKTGKAQKGQGTWYSYQGGLYAASLSIPRGGYAKVTNTANGKSVIVQINDSGPYGKGRIIDLDKVAFSKIASIGAGVIGVKVEEVLN